MDINKYNPRHKISEKHMLSLANYTQEDIFEILHLSRELKIRTEAGEKLSCLKNKYISLLTKKSFARSRIAFEMAVSELGGSAIISSLKGSEVEEMIQDKDTVTAITRYGINGIMVLTSELGDAEALNKYVTIPLINANSKSSPCETLATLYTLWQNKGTLSNLKLAVIGNPAIYSSSLIHGAIKCGIDISIICPENMYPDKELINYCRQYGDVSVFNNIREGIKNVDAVYVSDDNLGKEFLLTKDLLKGAKPETVIMHTLPLNRNGDITEELIDSKNSVIYEQAENLLHVEKAILTLLIGKYN